MTCLNDYFLAIYVRRLRHISLFRFLALLFSNMAIGAHQDHAVAGTNSVCFMALLNFFYQVPLLEYVGWGKGFAFDNDELYSSSRLSTVAFKRLLTIKEHHKGIHLVHTRLDGRQQ